MAATKMLCLPSEVTATWSAPISIFWGTPGVVQVSPIADPTRKLGSIAQPKHDHAYIEYTWFAVPHTIAAAVVVVTLVNVAPKSVLRYTPLPEGPLSPAMKTVAPR